MTARIREIQDFTSDLYSAFFIYQQVLRFGEKCAIIGILNPSTTSIPKCFQCGSPLILVSQKTTHPEGSLFPQTVSVYRCSNQECQEQKDKEELKRIKLRDDKLESDKKRAEDKKRRLNEKILAVIGKEEEQSHNV